MKRWRRRVVLALAVVAALLGAAALGGWWWLRVPVVDASWPVAQARFAGVLNGDLEQEDHAISSLAGALEREPENASAQLWFGLANMHAFIRRRELPYAIRASRAFDRAVELDPSDTSAAGWRAFFAYQTARARDEDLEAPRQALMDAAARDPRFTPFLAALVLTPMPLESGWPARALPPLEAIEDCGDGTSHTCRVSPLFPHGAEGYHATLGDVRIRLGDVDGGRRAYARALEMESASTWPYREAFEAWAASAEERAAQLGDDDPSNDPPVLFATGDRACATCHER